MRVLPLHMLTTAWHSAIIMGYDSIYFVFFFLSLLFALHFGTTIIVPTAWLCLAVCEICLHVRFNPIT